ncbi:MAG: amidohydrolase family protein [Acidobacteria bacterium]|nr:amidohydrolase family protein [Acidobacteriota bacterium]
MKPLLLGLFACCAWAATGDLALVGGKIYPSPDSNPIQNGVVWIRDGRIAAVDEKDKVQLSAGIRVLNCTGLTVTAGFWNSHVHFSEMKWLLAAVQPSSRLARQLEEMFTRYGFTTVFDTGSFFGNTAAIRRRIEAGQIAGPKIFTTGPGLVKKGGTPVYLRPLRLPEVRTPEEATAMVREKLKDGADGIKIFSASAGVEGAMPLELVKAVTAEAHQQGKLVLAHPQNLAGLKAAVEGGVDVLAHTTLALMPTLKLWKFELERKHASEKGTSEFLRVGEDQLRAFSQAGGQILFGTDVGYMSDYDPTDEYRLMAEAGLSFRQILASLTTAPAERFGGSKRTGRVAPGMEADLVVLAGDPAGEIAAFSKVRYTLQRGKIIYRGTGPKP